MLDSGVGPVTVAKAYRLLKAIMTTAVEDRLIRQNPCRIKGAGEEKSPERPVLTLGQVFVLADAFDRRYRLLILLAVFCSLRWGELAALTRDALDVDTETLVVRAGVVELKNGALVTGPPKSEASNRVLTIPDFSSLTWPNISRPSLDLALVLWSSQDRREHSSGVATSPASGARHWKQPG